MSIKVRFFASLSDVVGSSEIELDYIEGLSVLDAWAKTSPNDPLPSGSLFAINHNYSEPDDILQDGDEIAFFPPLTGG
jgi:molybdopterin synthase sulfur carrier subunit